MLVWYNDNSNERYVYEKVWIIRKKVPPGDRAGLFSDCAHSGDPVGI